MANSNSVLNTARKQKRDEFYTRICDIEKEVENYKDLFADKIVLCNCNDAIHGDFKTYFEREFHNLKLKSLICTAYDDKENGIENGFMEEYNGTSWKRSYFNEKGDFRNNEMRKILSRCDIVATNPPFSLFREFLDVIINSNKKFLILGNMNTSVCKSTFQYLIDNKVWFGVTNFNTGLFFEVQSDFEYADTYNYNKFINDKQVSRVPSITWFTNMEHYRRKIPLVLTKKYDSIINKKYDNCNAINVNKVEDIPNDYYETIGVPITFIDKWNPKQFKIVGKLMTPIIEGKHIYKRLLIKRVK